MCYQHQTNPSILSPEIVFSKSKASVFEHEDACIQSELLRILPDITQESNTKHYEWIEIQSTRLRRGMYIMLNYDIFRPTFGKVVNIICYESSVILHMQMFSGEIYVSQYNAFLLNSNSEFCAHELNTIEDYRPVIVKHSFEKELYAMLPYYY